MRIYYMGKVSDGVKVIEYGGNWIFPPAGCLAEKAVIPVVDGNGEPVMLQNKLTNKKFQATRNGFVVKLDKNGKPVKGPRESCHDIPDVAASVFLTGDNNADSLLVPESKYKSMMGVDEIREAISELEKRLVEKEAAKEPKPAPAGRFKKQEPDA